MSATAFFSCSIEEVSSPREDFKVWTVNGSFSSSSINLTFCSCLLNQGGIPSELEDTVAALGGTLTLKHEEAGIAVVGGVSSDDVDELALVTGAIEYVQDEIISQEQSTVNENYLVAADTVPASAEAPNAAYFFSWQWNMRAIQAETAWRDERLGSSEVTVAILDTGIDYLHMDLQDLVDLDRSKSFLALDDSYASFFFPERHLITDLDFHGTHVAATVASNAHLAAGVTSKTKLMGVKVCSIAGGCPFYAILFGLLHAADNGADVANLSLGGAFLKFQNPRLVGYINRVFNYANQKKMTVVVAAGNTGSDLDHSYPSLYKTFCESPNTICVSATGPTDSDDFREGPWYEVDAPAWYTNYGSSSITVAAPGGNYGGVVWSACTQTSLHLNLQDCSSGNYVVAAAGTSMASPHVAGLAALAVEKVGKNPGRVKALIQQGADDLGKPGVDPYYGKGRINVAKTLGIGK